MTEQNTINYSCKTKETVVTLCSKNTVKIAGEDMKIDPMLLFLNDLRQLANMPMTCHYSSNMNLVAIRCHCLTYVIFVALKHILAEAFMVDQGNISPPVRKLSYIC